MGTPSLINPAQQDGYSAGSTDPAQQPPSAHPTNQQLQSPPPPTSAPQNAPQPQGDPLEQLKQQMVQQYQASQQPPASGGRIKQLLGNFFSGMGDGMMHDAGLPTPYDKQQTALKNIEAISTTQNTAAYHQALAAQFGNTPVTMPDGNVVNVLNKDVGKVYEGLARAHATQTAAQTRTITVPGVGAFNWDDEQGKYVPVQGGQVPQHMLAPGEAGQLGFAPGTTQVPTSAYSQAVGAKTKQVGTVQGASGPSLVNKLSGKTTDLGLGSPSGARFVPVTDPETGLSHYMPAGAAAATGAIAQGSNLEKNAFTPKARFDDVNRATTFLNGNVDAMDQDATQKGLIANALQAPEASHFGALNAFKNSELAKQLNPKSRDYVNAVLSLREQIMGINAILSPGGGSDARTNRIMETLPGVEPDSDSARRKMTQVEGMIKNVKEAFPQVKAIEDAQAKASAKSAGSAKMPPGNGMVLDTNNAQLFLKAAGGDKVKARQLATQSGWKLQ